MPVSGYALSTSESLFEQGVKFFRAEKYKQAVIKFRAAEKSGLKSVALYYNMASSFYKLEQYSYARYYFEQLLTRSDMEYLARYNLGLIAVKEGHTKQAKHYFTSVYEGSANEKLKALSKKQLAELKKIGDDWSVFLASNLGYDDNITASPIDSALGRSDNFYDLFASADKVIYGTRKQGWLVDASYFRIDFSDDDRFDEYQYALGIRTESKLMDWVVRGKVSVDKNYFGGSAYQSSLNLDLSGKYKPGRNERIALRYRYQDISSEDSLFDYLEGWRQRLKAEYKRYSKKYIYQFHYELELNDRGVLATSEYAYDYSATRHTVFARYTYILDKQWDLIADLSYRLSDYPSSASFNRDDNKMVLSLRADYRLQNKWKIKVRIQSTDNNSTVDRYDYEKLVYSVGFNKLF